MKKTNKNKFNTLYYTGLTVYASVVFFIIVIIASIFTFAYNKIEDKHKAEIEAASYKNVIPVVKQIIYDTIPVYDTIRPVSHARPKSFAPINITKEQKDSL